MLCWDASISHRLPSVTPSATGGGDGGGDVTTQVQQGGISD